jgi:hypothetical protein
MGTSLSGLTPATTFDGLLKVGDNDPLTATLKAISTGDGTDTILQLSNSALQIGGTFNVDGGIATFKGVGSSSLTSSFIIKNSADDEIFRVRDDQQIFAKYINGQSVSASTYALYGADYAPNIRVNIKGSGATSATTSLLVQNSAGSDYLKVTDDGNVQLGSSISVQSTGISAYNSIQLKTFIGGGVYESGLVLTGNGAPSKVGIGEITPTARLHIKGSGNDNTTTSLLVQNSDGTEHLKVTDDGEVNVRKQLYVNHASISSRYLSLGWGAVAANSTGDELSLYGGGGNNGAIIYLNGSTKSAAPQAIGMKTTGVLIAPSMVQSSFAPTAQLHVKGSGNDAATTALLVQNSAGADMLKVTDDGAIDFGALGLDFSNDGSGGTMSVAADRYIKLASSLSTYSALGAHLFKTFDGSAYSEAMRITGNTDQFVGIGETTPTARLHVKGSGAASATTTLLVQNSAGTDLFWARDDNTIRLSQYYAKTNSIHPTGAQDLGVNNVVQWHFGNIYSKGVTHITDNTTSSTTLDASAKLQVDSTTQGLLPPRMTDAERDAIATPAAGLMIYDTTNNQMNYWNGSTWIAF